MQWYDVIVNAFHTHLVRLDRLNYDTKAKKNGTTITPGLVPKFEQYGNYNCNTDEIGQKIQPRQKFKT